MAISIAPFDIFFDIFGAHGTFPSLLEIWIKILVRIDAKPFFASVDVSEICESLGLGTFKQSFLRVGYSVFKLPGNMNQQKLRSANLPCLSSRRDLIYSSALFWSWNCILMGMM